MYSNGPGFFTWAKRFDEVTASAVGGDDSARLGDSLGAEVFEAYPDHGTMTYEDGTFARAEDFRWLYAFASDDGQTDTAILHDLSGSDDLFQSWSTEAKMTGDGVFNRAKGFDEVVAGASDVTDVAKLNESPGTDVFEAYFDRATMTYEGGPVVHADDFPWTRTPARAAGTRRGCTMFPPITRWPTAPSSSSPGPAGARCTQRISASTPAYMTLTPLSLGQTA